MSNPFLQVVGTRTFGTTTQVIIRIRGDGTLEWVDVHGPTPNKVNRFAGDVINWADLRRFFERLVATA